MKNGVDNFTAERVAGLRKNIDFSDIPEIKDFSGGHLRNWKPAKKEEVKTEKSKKEQLVNFKLPIDKYEEYKKMFGAEGFSFSKGNRMCLDFILREIRDGNLELTESGFRKTASGRVGR